MVNEFLRNLPSSNQSNFSRFYSEAHSPSTSAMPRPVGLRSPSTGGQVIVNDETSLLLRYLQRRWDKRKEMERVGGGRTAKEAAADDSDSDPDGGAPSTSSKRPRLL